MVEKTQSGKREREDLRSQFLRFLSLSKVRSHAPSIVLSDAVKRWSEGTPSLEGQVNQTLFTQEFCSSPKYPIHMYRQEKMRWKASSKL